jgi:hypothetical protein
MDVDSYRKYILNDHALNFRSICICCSNYDIPKNCTYYLLTGDIYVIGYSIRTDYGDIEMPVFCNKRQKLVKKLHSDMLQLIYRNALEECGFPLPAVDSILRYINY